jgi:large subunit ribosomal protein L1
MSKDNKAQEKKAAQTADDELTELLHDDSAVVTAEAIPSPKEPTKVKKNQEAEPIGEAAEEASVKPVAKAGKRSAKAIAEAEAEEAKATRVAQVDSAEAKPVRAKKQVPNPKKRHGKRYRAAAELVDRSKQYDLSDALSLAKQTGKVKFDSSVEIHINLGVDPRQADQMVRSNVVLPAGTGKTLRTAVMAPADLQALAKAAGADIVGGEDLIVKFEKGQLDFDVLIATPDMMPKLGRVAKILGPKGLMPNPKSGTVTGDPAKAVTEAKAGKVEFRIDKQAIVHQAIGKVSFKDAALLDNAKTFINAVMRAKPAAAKGTYVKAMNLTTSMGPGIKLNVTQAIAEANPKK